MQCSTPPRFAEATVLLWLRSHRGLISAIANELDYSHEFVRQVAWGKRRNRTIERELRRSGWRRVWVRGAHDRSISRAA